MQPKDQAETSRIQVAQGLCCKAEVAKIELALVGITPLEFHVESIVDLREKCLILYHGTLPKPEMIQRIKAVCSILQKEGFECQALTVAEEALLRSEYLISKGLDPMDKASIHTKLEEISDVVSYRWTADEYLTLQHVKNAGLPIFTELSHFFKQKGYNFKINLVEGVPIVTFQITIGKGFCCEKEASRFETALEGIRLDPEAYTGFMHFQIMSKTKQIEVSLPDDSTKNDTLSTICKRLESCGEEIIIASIEHASSKKRKGEASLPNELGMLEAPNPKSQIDEELLVEKSEASMYMSTATSSQVSTVQSALSVEGLCCQTEATLVTSYCKGIPGVLEVTISTVTKRVYVSHSASQPDVPSTCAQVLSANHFPAKVISSGVSAEKIESPHQKPKSIFRSFRWSLFIATFLWGVSWLSFVRPPESMEYLKYLSIGAVALGLPLIALKGLRGLRQGIMDENFLMCIAVIGALALQNFHEAATVTVIYSWGSWLEDRASSSARNALLLLMQLKPEFARTEDGREIPADDVQVGQVLVVRTGDKFSVDGVLLSPFCDVNESNLTGEAIPVTKKTADIVNAGTLNVSSTAVTMRCTALARDSAMARMIRLIEQASSERSPTEQLIVSVAKYYTPIVVLTAILMASVPWSKGPTVGQMWLHTALTLLVISCPCALIISTPITYVSAIARSARFGVIVKGGKHLETLSRVTRLACDKTGTLTRGEFEVDETFEFPNYSFSKKEAYAVLDCMERQAAHPIAKAIQRHCERVLSDLEKDSSLRSSMLPICEVSTIPGRGIQATLPDGKIAYVLREEARAQVCRETSDEADEWSAQQIRAGETVCWLVVDGQPLLGIAASDQVRDSASEALDELTRMGIDVIVLTGDNAGAAAALHSKLPQISRIFAGLDPASKVDHVKTLKQDKKHTVAMIGDGVNDAPALAASEAGIAMGVGGAPVAMETADCALMDNDLRKIPMLLKHAKRTRRKLMENISFSLCSKALMLGLAIAGYISLGVAIAVEMGSMLLVIINGVSLLRGSRPNKVELLRRPIKPTSSK